MRSQSFTCPNTASAGPNVDPSANYDDGLDALDRYVKVKCDASVLGWQLPPSLGVLTPPQF